MFDKLSVLALNIKSILQINCFGDLTFCETLCACKAKSKLTLGWVCTDEEWMVRVFAIPLLMVAIAALRYAYVLRKKPEDAEDAAGNFHSHIFGIVFLVYRMSPFLCNTQYSF